MDNIEEHRKYFAGLLSLEFNNREEYKHAIF